MKGDRNDGNIKKYQKIRNRHIKRRASLSGRAGNKQNAAVSITLFSFWKGEEISTHESGGDAFVTCLDGVGSITVDEVKYELCEGQSIVMPARHPHAVCGKENFKMLLVVVF